MNLTTDNRQPTTLIALLLLFTTPAFSQQYGSAWRKDFEKESNGPHGECRVDWREIAPEIDYRRIDCLGDPDDADVHVIRIDPDRWELNVSIVEGGSTARRVANEKDAAFVINGSFFNHDRDPLGVLVRSGENIQRPRSSSWQSIFFIDGDGQPRIILPRRWPHYRDDAWMAVQAGPRIVIGGHTNRVHRGYAAARAGVCIHKNGDLLFFATPQERKFNMYEITRVARRGEIDGGLECREAMLLDGGHSTQFYVEGEDERIHVSGDPVPVFIYATRR